MYKSRDMKTTAFQMEDLSLTNRDETHTLALMQEAGTRDYKIYQFEPKDVSLIDGDVVARAREVEIDLSSEDFYSYSAPEIINLAEIDVIHIRQDPPFNMEYITSTYFLERIKNQSLIVNNSSKIRDFPEKIYPLEFQEFMPPTLITRDIKMVEEFKDRYQDIIIKPLYDFHGNGVIRSAEDDENFDAYLEMTLARESDPIIVQKYLPEIKQGNKRIIFLDGEVKAALKTVPGSGEFRIYRNSTDHIYELNDHDKKLCAILGAEFKKHDLLFVGIDMIGDYLTEINVTSVGSIRRINKLYNKKFEAEIWDAIEAKL